MSQIGSDFALMWLLGRLVIALLRVGSRVRHLGLYGFNRLVNFLNYPLFGQFTVKLIGGTAQLGELLRIITQGDPPMVLFIEYFVHSLDLLY